MIGDAAAAGMLVAPEDGPVCWTAHGDLAEAAATILRDDGRFEGPTPPLTAAEVLDLEDVAAILSDLHDRPVERRVITDQDQANRMAEQGAPSGAIETTLGLYRAARAGEFDVVDPTLATLLGRAPTPLRDVIAAGRDL